MHSVGHLMELYWYWFRVNSGALDVPVGVVDVYILDMYL